MSKAAMELFRQIEGKRMTEIKDEILHQAWLKAAMELFRQNFFDFPDTVATYGFPAPNSSDGFRGACHHPDEKGKDRRPVIIIHPAEWKDPIEVLTVLLHECIHAKLGKPAKKGDDGHGEDFIEIATSVGLSKNAQGAFDTRNGILQGNIEAAVKMLPEMPKDPLGRGEVKSQKGRMKLFICTCGFKIRCGKEALLAMCKRCNTDFVMKGEE